MKKSFVIILLAFSLILSAFPVYAAGESSLEGDIVISPNYTYIMLLHAGLTINSSGKAQCVGGVDASSNSYDAELTVSLQKYENGSWKSVKSWSDSGTGQSNLLIDEPYYVVRGTYRVRTTARIFDRLGKLLESASLNSDEVTY